MATIMANNGHGNTDWIFMSEKWHCFFDFCPFRFISLFLFSNSCSFYFTPYCVFCSSPHFAFFFNILLHSLTLLYVLVISSHFPCLFRWFNRLQYLTYVSFSVIFVCLILTLCHLLLLPPLYLFPVNMKNVNVFVMDGHFLLSQTEKGLVGLVGYLVDRQARGCCHIWFKSDSNQQGNTALAQWSLFWNGWSCERTKRESDCGKERFNLVFLLLNHSWMKLKIIIIIDFPPVWGVCLDKHGQACCCVRIKD